MRVRAVSWNVHSWRDSYFRPQFSDMLAILHDLRPDLLLLQEARWHPDRGVYSPEISTLRTEFDLQGFAFCPTHTSPVRHHSIGHVILARPALTDSRSHPLGQFLNMKRLLLTARARFGPTTLNLATTHLSPWPLPGLPAWHWEWLPRCSETRNLINCLSEADGPVLLGVDMNAQPAATDVSRLASVLRPASLSHQSHVTGCCLDYIFASPNLQVNHLPVNLTNSPSDHYPVAADLILPG